MNKVEINEILEKYHNEIGKFSLVEKKLSKYPLVHAIMLLDQICFRNDSTQRIDIGFGDEGISLDLCDMDNLTNLTEDHIIELIRCGISYYDRLCFYYEDYIT
jgi:hypothetical protein